MEQDGKQQFVLVNYNIKLFKKMQNLLSKGVSKKEYSEKFYRLRLTI